MQTKVQCKFYHQLLSKLSKFREKGNKKGFRKSHFSFSNFLNFWKLKNRICYHLKPMFLNSYQGCYSIVLLTLIRLGAWNIFRLGIFFAHLPSPTSDWLGLKIEHNIKEIWSVSLQSHFTKHVVWYASIAT